MTQDTLLDYLKKYTKNPKLIELNQLSKENRDSLPDYWIEILSAEPKKRPKIALSYWNEFKEELDQVIEYLEKNLISVDLIHHAFGFCLLYGIKSANTSKILYYEGRNPKTKKANADLMRHWELLPNSLKNFYDKLHNGWYYLASGSMGLSPIEDCFFLDEEDWEIAEKIEELPIKLENTLAIYTNGMGGYICIEFKENTKDCLLWWSSKPPKLNLELWPVIDSWTAIGFES